ncbi:MAG: hypothetical protein A2161_16940 [Candidatus Schekmanbacteria bacterium RBG_13_48_7]|uniref:SpoVT-AbrB domain-containing protein n=1 Tax=Candidatus Schekmanbacteria bacterium RBG_13_48_7 TaxID=1817878 RepID=A0A1F7RRX1_9BACT|nr:MAG: hypothetical protein A2161_16940 [Candidatus Schekmanbacteria bacterium RBG_13_48_7]
MSVSIVTKKGQTTIPKDIRNILKLKPNDKILYIIDGEKVILKPLKGNILELRGTVPKKGKSVDIHKIRNETKKKVSNKTVERIK